MSDGLDMDIDETSYQVRVLAAIRDDLHDECRGPRADLDWLSGTLGRGPMGARFKTAYEPSRTSLETQFDANAQRTAALATAAQQAVDQYQTANAHAVAEIFRVKFK